MARPIVALTLCALAGCASSHNRASPAAAGAASTAGTAPTSPVDQPRLGNFSVSLAVKDLAASRSFYEKLGFRPILGDGKRWQIMQNSTATVGLFQGMLSENGLTFNPGWDRSMKTLADFDDVRDVQRTLESRGLKLASRAEPGGSGPASIVLTDPDGNTILIDQHVLAPKSRGSGNGGGAGGGSGGAATKPHAAGTDEPASSGPKTCTLESGDRPVLRLTVDSTAECTTHANALHLERGNLKFDIWLVPSAHTLDQGVQQVGPAIDLEFREFHPATVSDLTIAGAPAKRLIGPGVEADDSDPGTADVIVFTVFGRVFVACAHGEHLPPTEQQWMLKVVQTAAMP